MKISKLKGDQLRKLIGDLNDGGLTVPQIVQQLRRQKVRGTAGTPLTEVGVRWHLTRRSRMPQERRKDSHVLDAIPYGALGQHAQAKQAPECPKPPTLSEMLPRNTREAGLAEFWYERGRREMALELSPEFQTALKRKTEVKLI